MNRKQNQFRKIEICLFNGNTYLRSFTYKKNYINRCGATLPFITPSIQEAEAGGSL